MKNKQSLRRVRNVICLLLVACYVAGMLCMLLNAFPIGLALWVISTAGGLAVMYHIKIEENKIAEAERLKKAAEGSEDEPCE